MHKSSATIVRLVLFVITVALFAFVFRGVIFEHRFFSFRDTPNFHSPLFRLVQDQWRQGQLPLWNPYAVGGMPLLAIGTSAVLYPPQLIFLLPLDFETNLVWFLLTHFLFAIFFQYVFSRRVGCSPVASAVAAIVYVFGGSVLFQYSNVPFLCSAAWMPAALYAVHRAIVGRTFVWSAIFGVTLAMMVLAGDPQNAYHAVILASLFALIYGLGSRNRSMKNLESSGREKGPYSRFLGSSIVSSQVLVIVAAVWGLALSSAQLFPTQELAKLSTRSEWSIPDNVYRIPSYFLKDQVLEPRSDTGVSPNWYDVIVGDPPPPAKQYLARYQYSFIPWRIMELALPNVFGTSEHPSSRWLARHHGEDPQFWIPSVYAGLLPLILAWNATCATYIRTRHVTPRTKPENKVAADQGSTNASLALKSLRIRKLALSKRKPAFSELSPLQEVNDVGHGIVGSSVSMENAAKSDDRDDMMVRCWASWVCCLGFLFSFGGYGLVWLARLVFSGSLTHPYEIPGGEVGGGYWFLSTFFPAYADFRYPSKWLTVAAFGFAILSGKGYDALLQSNESIAVLGRRMRMIGGLALLVAIVLMMISSIPSAVSSAFLHAGIVAVVCWLWCRCTSYMQRGSTLPLWNVIPVAIIALDLAVANHCMVHHSPTTDRAGIPELAAVIHRHWEDTQGDFPSSESVPRIYVPYGVVGDHFHLMTGFFAANQNIGYFEASTGTMQIARNEFFLDVLPYPTERGTAMLQPRRALDLWGVDYFVVPKPSSELEVDDQLPGLGRQWQKGRPEDMNTLLPEGAPIVPIKSSGRQPLENVDVLPNQYAMPDAWVVHRLEVHPPLTSYERSELVELMFSIVFPYTRHRDLRDMAIVESAGLINTYGEGMTVLASPQESAMVEVVRRSPSEVEISADLPAEGLVVLADTYYPGWTAVRHTKGQSQPVEILRTNLAMRGMQLPAGQHRIVMTYSPMSFHIGSLVSVLSLAGLLLTFAQKIYFDRRKAKFAVV